MPKSCDIFLIFISILHNSFSRCAAATREKKYTHFAIQEYGECLSGPDVRKTYNQQGKETAFRFRPDTKPWVGCMDTDYKQCKQPSSTCIGQELTNFVYGLENGNSLDILIPSAFYNVEDILTDGWFISVFCLHTCSFMCMCAFACVHVHVSLCECVC